MVGILVLLLGLLVILVPILLVPILLVSQLAFHRVINPSESTSAKDRAYKLVINSKSSHGVDASFMWAARWSPEVFC